MSFGSHTPKPLALRSVRGYTTILSGLVSNRVNLAALAPRFENGAFKHVKQRRRLVRVYCLLLLARHAVLSRSN